MRTLSLALGLATLLPGCSWLFVEAPPPGHERLRYFDCSTSRAAPIVDTVMASLYGLSTAVMVAQTVGGESDRTDQEIPVMVVSAGLATMFGISAAHGFGTTADCDEAKAAWAERTLTAPPPAWSVPNAPRPCGSDADCAGDRICEQNACVLPPEQVLPPDPTVPAQPAAAEPTGPAPPTTTPTTPSATPAATTAP